MCYLWFFENYIEKCYKCSGNEDECGIDLSSLKNVSKEIKWMNCGKGDCWVFRREINSVISFERGCMEAKCNSTYESESCEAIEDKKLCKKCCNGNLCNTWNLDGKAKSNILSFHPFSIFLSLCLSLFFFFIKTHIL